MPASESVPTFSCLGGCGTEIDAENHPDGLCSDCRTAHGHAEPDPLYPKPHDEGFKRRSD